MEIRDPIHGMIAVSNQESKVLGSGVFQRLRLIKQLGFSEFSFPGAAHNRYIHSIGACHLAGRAFDEIFCLEKQQEHGVSLTPVVKAKLRQTVKLAALLHDVGHGPLSHSSECAMGPISALNIKAYNEEKRNSDKQASHEDYGIKLITESDLMSLIDEVDPMAVACLIDEDLTAPEGYFVTDAGYNIRPLLQQLVSSELDVDRMDYLERDAFHCGSHYGKIELSWLLAHMSAFVEEGQVYLALDRLAIYAFEDFLLSRHHMNLMVYNHHKSVIYEELLQRYFDEEGISFKFPTDVEGYIDCTDHTLWQCLKKDADKSEWASRIVNQKTYKRVLERHSSLDVEKSTSDLRDYLEKSGKFPVIYNKTTTSLSRYYSKNQKALPFFIVDKYDLFAQPTPIQEATALFKRYAEARHIERIYVPEQSLQEAQELLRQFAK